MTDRPRPLVAGNWKMNGLKASLGELSGMARHYDAGLRAKLDLLICPPVTLANLAAHVALGTHISIGAQDCHPKTSGAHTGDVSAEMLSEMGLTHVIVGHSQRRADHGESDGLVRSKAEAAVAAGLVAIVCVGESEAERRGGKTLDVIGRQIDGSIPPGLTAAQLVLAYEPVWAIGSGLTPTAADVAEVHAFIRDRLGRLVGTERLGVRLLYGGSVKPSNAAELMGVANVDGALVGGASLKADDFMAIASVYR
jgi:triosephosphate isomerase